jgi:hypothetical protein
MSIPSEAMESEKPTLSEESEHKSEIKYADDQLAVETEEPNLTFWQSVQPVTLRNIGATTVCALLIIIVWSGAYYLSHSPQVLPVDMWRLSAECREEVFLADRMLDLGFAENRRGWRNETLSRTCSREYGRAFWPYARIQHKPWRWTKNFVLIPEHIHREDARLRHARVEATQRATQRKKPQSTADYVMLTTTLYQLITSQAIRWGIVVIGLLRYVIKGGTRTYRLREACQRVALKVFDWYPYSSALTTMIFLCEAQPSAFLWLATLAWVVHFLCWRVLLTIHLARYPARTKHIRFAFFIGMLYFDQGLPASLVAPRLSWALGTHLVPLIANFALPPRDGQGDSYRGQNLRDPAIYGMVCLLSR